MAVKTGESKEAHRKKEGRSAKLYEAGKKRAFFLVRNERRSCQTIRGKMETPERKGGRFDLSVRKRAFFFHN